MIVYLIKLIYYLHKVMLKITKGLSKHFGYMFSYKNSLINSISLSDREALK